MLEREHHHWLAGSTSREHGHSHSFTGHTKRFIQLDNNHCHRIKVIVVVDKDHDHIMDIMTGPGIYDEHGHYHRYIGKTTISGRPQHEHRFDRITSPPLGYYY